MTPVAMLVKALVGLALAYAVVLLLAWRFQERMALPGAPAPLIPPARAGIPDGEIVTVETADGVSLKGWYLPPAPTGTAALIWFYGNMENVTGLAPIIRFFRPPGVAVLALDYRGYGESDGVPSEKGLYLDADAAWAFLAARPELDSSRIAVYGRSVGSAPALYLATTHPVRALILESPFTSATDMARVHYPFLPRSILRLEMNNLRRAASLTAPLLVLQGDQDQIAPPWMGRAVAESGHARELVVIHGAGHNQTYDMGGKGYRDKVLAFLSQSLQ